MPRIDPQQLLKTLGVLLGPHGGIKSSEEVVRLVQLMQKFSRKLVSKCIYIRILKATPNELLEHFLSEHGWELLNQWFSDAIKTQNWPLCREMIQLFNMCHISATRLKENVNENHAPKLINQLRQEDSVDEDIKSLAAEVYIKWVRTVSPVASAKITHGRSKGTNKHSTDGSEDNESASDDSKEGKDGTISLLQSLADEVSENIKKEENKKLKADKLEKRDGKTSKPDSGKVSHRGDDKNRDKSKSSHSHSNSHRSSHEKDRKKDSVSSRRDSSSRHSSRDKEHRRIRHTDARDEVNDEEKQRIREKARKLKEEAQAKKDKETLTKVSGGSSSASSLSKIPKIPKKSVKEEDKKKGSSFSDMLGTLDSKPTTWRKPLLKNKTAAMLESMTKSSSTSHKSSKENSLKSSSSASVKKENDNSSKDKDSLKKESSSSAISGKKDSVANKNSLNGDSRRPTLNISDSNKNKRSPGKESPKSSNKSPSITSSTGFMEAIFSTMKKDEPKKRKRRLSDREDSKLEDKANSQKDGSPEKKLKEEPKDDSKPIPTFSFYRELDTTETNMQESKKDVSKEIKASPKSSPPQTDDQLEKSFLNYDLQNNGIKEEKIGDDSVIPFDEPTDLKPREVKGILVYHRGKDKRNKTIKWKPESNLVAVRYFELDEDERVNVNKLKFENMREFETKMEKAALASKPDIGNDEQEILKWYTPVPLSFDENSDYKPCFTAYGLQSTEKAAQNEREKTVLQALYFNLETTPNTPSEPDNPSDSLRGMSNGATIIPLEDKDADEGSYHNYTQEGWPDAKANSADNEYAASISSAFSLPPALSTLLASIETDGLESIIPSPGSLSQEDQSTLAAQTAALQKLGMIPGVDINPNFPPPVTNLQSNNIAGNGMNMDNHAPPGGQHMPPQKPLGIEPFVNHNMSGFPPPGHNVPSNMPQHAPFGMAPPDHMQDNGFNNFNQHQMQQNPFHSGPFPGGMPNHRGGNHFGRGANHNGFRGTNNGADFFDQER